MRNLPVFLVTIATFAVAATGNSETTDVAPTVVHDVSYDESLENSADLLLETAELLHACNNLEKPTDVELLNLDIILGHLTMADKVEHDIREDLEVSVGTELRASSGVSIAHQLAFKQVWSELKKIELGSRCDNLLDRS